MSKLIDYECPCNNQMYLKYEIDRHDNITIVILCECEFNWRTNFSQVHRINKTMVKRAIGNFYNNHTHKQNCNFTHTQ